MKLTDILNQGSVSTAEPGGSRADGVPVGTLSNAVGLLHPKWQSLDGRSMHQDEFPELTAVLQQLGQPTIGIPTLNSNSRGSILEHNRTGGMFNADGRVARDFSYSPDGSMLAVLFAGSWTGSNVTTDIAAARIAIFDTSDWSVIHWWESPAENYVGTYQRNSFKLQFSPQGNFLAYCHTSWRWTFVVNAPSSVTLYSTADWSMYPASGASGSAQLSYGSRKHWTHDAIFSREEEYFYHYGWDTSAFNIYAKNNPQLTRTRQNSAQPGIFEFQWTHYFRESPSNAVIPQNSWWDLKNFTRMQLSPDETVIYLFGLWQKEGETYANGVIALDADTGEIVDLFPFQIPMTVNVAVFSRDGTKLLVGGHVFWSDADLFDSTTPEFTHFIDSGFRYGIYDVATGQLDISYTHAESKLLGSTIQGGWPQSEAITDVGFVDFDRLFYIVFGNSVSSVHIPWATEHQMRAFRVSDGSRVTDSDPAKAFLLPAPSFYWTLSPKVAISPNGSYVACTLTEYSVLPDKELYPIHGRSDGFGDLHIYRGPTASVGISMPNDNASRRVFTNHPVKIKALP